MVWHNGGMNIVFDIGGTKLRVATTWGSELKEVHKIPTPKDLNEAVATLVAIAREKASGEPIRSFVGCIAGTVSSAGILTDARNLASWEGTNIVDVFTNAAGMPVTIVNDAGMAGYGEAHAGAGQGAEIVMYITVSTGVGGARIVKGEIDQAGGVGHTPLRGSDLESLVSGKAVKNKFGIEPKDLESIEVRTALADTLAEGLALLAQKWTPNCIVLGGSMITGVNPIPLAVVQEKMPEYLVGYPHSITVKMAQLGDIGGLTGAAIMAENLLSAQEK